MSFIPFLQAEGQAKHLEYCVDYSDYISLHAFNSLTCFRPIFSGQKTILFDFACHLPKSNFTENRLSYSEKLRILNLWVNLVIWKVHNRGPSAGPSAIYIQPMHDIRYYLPDEVDVFRARKQSDDFLTYWMYSLLDRGVCFHPSLFFPCDEGFGPECAVTSFHSQRRCTVPTVRRSCCLPQHRLFCSLNV